jgi:hypothetical protein
VKAVLFSDRIKTKRAIANTSMGTDRRARSLRYALATGVTNIKSVAIASMIPPEIHDSKIKLCGCIASGNS